MPVDRDVYPEPPSQTPVRDNKSGLPDLGHYVSTGYYYLVDRPVTLFHDWVEHQRSKRKIYYYHRVFQRVPDLSHCLEDDVPCQFEAESQWRRDFQVNSEIVKIIQERLNACMVREGSSASQNCSKEIDQYADVCSAYKSIYGDLGANGNARKCLMKQKQQMIKEKEEAKAAQ
ncbi:NADH dehydrogenase [ubiquinone] 1 beta subcomplex subunit 10 [Mantella aurantiaca]